MKATFFSSFFLRSSNRSSHSLRLPPESAAFPSLVPPPTSPPGSMAESPLPAPARRRYRVGYALAPKKQQSFIQPSLLSMAASRGIDLVAIDPLSPLSGQGPFDLILHKINSGDWAAKLREFAATHPSVPIIDPPHAIDRLHNRISMLQVVSELQIPQSEVTFGIPKQAVIYDFDSLSCSGSVDGLRFPVIAKPLVADGSATSHKMSLVFHRDDLRELEPPFVLQEFVNHGGVIFKVYVVGGGHMQCVKRQSLPDQPEDGRDCPAGPVSFSQVSNVSCPHASELEVSDQQHIEKADMPPPEFLEAIATELRHSLGIQLFNFDLIRDTKIGNHYLVIDINYFPGYAKMPCYETALTDFLWNAVQDAENGSGEAPGIVGGGEADDR